MPFGNGDKKTVAFVHSPAGLPHFFRCVSGAAA
jgi:hypothetical protein